MAKGRMAHVVAKGYGLDQVDVEPQCPSDVARDAADELLVKVSPGDVVVCRKGKDLGLSVKTVVCRGVDDLLAVADEGRTHEGRTVMYHVATQTGHVRRGKGRKLPRLVEGAKGFLGLRGKPSRHVRCQLVDEL